MFIFTYGFSNFKKGTELFSGFQMYMHMISILRYVIGKWQQAHYENIIIVTLCLSAATVWALITWLYHQSFITQTNNVIQIIIHKLFFVYIAFTIQYKCHMVNIIIHTLMYLQILINSVVDL